MTVRAVNEPLVEPQRRWHMYVLECAGARLYTGITLDLERRLKDHQAGRGAKFTRSFAPKACLLTIEFEDHSQAARAEYQFKQLSATAKRAFVETHRLAPEIATTVHPETSND